MVISKKVMRSKRGERERRAVREGERTGGQRERKSGWWAAPSPPFVMVGIGVASSLPCVVVDVGKPRRRHPFSLTSFVAVRSCPSRAAKLFGVAGLAFGVG